LVRREERNKSTSLVGKLESEDPADYMLQIISPHMKKKFV